MDEIKFWGQKRYAEDCLEENNIKELYSVRTIGRGHRGVEMWVHGLTNKEFIKKYGHRFESKYCKI